MSQRVKVICEQIASDPPDLDLFVHCASDFGDYTKHKPVLFSNGVEVNIPPDAWVVREWGGWQGLKGNKSFILQNYQKLLFKPGDLILVVAFDDANQEQTYRWRFVAAPSKSPPGSGYGVNGWPAP